MKPVPTRITDFVHRFAGAEPGREAVVFGNERLTYRQLESRVDDFARALLAMGIGHGDRVAMLSTSRTEYWVCFLATAGIGAIWVGLNPRHRIDEYRYLIGDSEPRLLIGMCEFEGRSYRDDLMTLKDEHAFLERLIIFDGEVDSRVDGASSLESFLEAGKSVGEGQYAAARESVDRLDPCLIVYTSGSTGKPKGAMLSHHGLVFGSLVQTDHFAVEHPRVIVNFPIDHVACVADTCSTTLVKGGTIVFQERFDPAATLAAVEAERATIWGGVPTMLQLALNLPDFDRYDLSSVEAILWGGAAMPRDAIVRLQRSGARLMSMYGMTETSAHVTYTDADADAETLAETVGRPDPRFPCRIVDEHGRECAPGQQGELQFRGDYLMLGYYRRPRATAEAFTDDGWLHTGDLGYWREDGNITLVGRMSEMFKSGGYNVYPREIELVLEEHLSVAMAAVISVSDSVYQEVGHAYILVEPGSSVSEGELIDFCRQRLANYKVPKAIHVRSQLPMLPVGKIDKKALQREDARRSSKG